MSTESAVAVSAADKGSPTFGLVTDVIIDDTLEVVKSVVKVVDVVEIVKSVALSDVVGLVVLSVVEEVVELVLLSVAAGIGGPACAVL
jgi:hypothetical protein